MKLLLEEKYVRKNKISFKWKSNTYVSFLDFNHCTEQDAEVEGAMAADHLNAKFINLDLDLNKVQGKINE